MNVCSSRGNDSHVELIYYPARHAHRSMQLQNDSHDWDDGFGVFIVRRCAIHDESMHTIPPAQELLVQTILFFWLVLPPPNDVFRQVPVRTVLHDQCPVCGVLKGPDEPHQIGTGIAGF